jgi:hypothetical protein
MGMGRKGLNVEWAAGNNGVETFSPIRCRAEKIEGFLCMVIEVY